MSLKIAGYAAGAFILLVLISPMPRFESPLSTVLEARDGTLLGARIADDGQWRFPPGDSVPWKFEKAILAFEDRYFYYHPGINPVALFRALIQNIRAGEIVSGGSTLTMQVSRLANGNSRRTYFRKITEILSAIKLEIFRSKKDIINMYVSNAPFGGNLVGLEAATWRYSGSSPDNLSWAEAATYAVLPNSPSLIHPGRNRDLLKEKRDRLLAKLFSGGLIDSVTMILAIDEPILAEPRPLPSKAPHLTDMMHSKRKGERIRTTIDPVLQEKASDIINTHQLLLSNNFIFNSACIIVGVKYGEVLAYVGNSTLDMTADHSGKVDLVQALRSTGSILKPILYAGMQYSGEILPNTLIPDIPTYFTGFSPKNFDLSFSGAVPASEALTQSLNIPAVRMLQKYDPERFLSLLKKSGFSTFSKTSDHYGLSLILGGGETSLWELTGVYASMSRVLERYNEENRYSNNDYHPPVFTLTPAETPDYHSPSDIPLSASAIWLTYQSLMKVNRPDRESGWQYFSSSGNLAWKTGTSFGFRDAWAVGTTPEYVIGVWAGNADGEGRPGLTGTSAAAPVLFDIFNYLRCDRAFRQPSEEMTVITVCSRSGYRAGPYCTETSEIPACTEGLKTEACPYHKIIHLNRSRTLRVSNACESPEYIINENWFVLPPAMEFFYKKKNAGYIVLPPVAPGCTDDKSIPAMEFIYPSGGIRIFIPRDQTGEFNRIIPEIAHRIPSKKVFWHLDEKYVATTRYIHQVELIAPSGQHKLTAVDEDGNTVTCSFIITNTTEVLPGSNIRPY